MAKTADTIPPPKTLEQELNNKNKVKFAWHLNHLIIFLNLSLYDAIIPIGTPIKKHNKTETKTEEKLSWTVTQ